MGVVQEIGSVQSLKALRSQPGLVAAETQTNEQPNR